MMFIDRAIQQLSLLKGRNGLRKILANISWLFADRILRMGFGLVVGVWVARYIGVQQFGILNYATAFVAIFNPLATLGLDAVVVRKLVAQPTQQQSILGTSFWLRFIAGWLTWWISILGVYLLRPDDSTMIITVTILGAASIFQSIDTIDLWFQSQIQSKYSVLAKNAAFILVTSLRVVLITIRAPLIGFVLVILMEAVLGAIGLLIVYQKQGHLIRVWHWSSSLAKDLLRESFPLILSGLTIMIYMRIDQIMLGQMIGDKAVGVYSAATRISEVWYFIPMTVSSSVMPSIFQAKEISEQLYYQRIGELNRVLTWMAILVAIVMTFVSKPLIMLLFGNNFVESGAILSVHIWASVFVFSGVATSGWFIAENLTYLSLYRTLSGAVVNILLNIFLIPIYGGLGAAIATVIAQAVASFISNGINPKTRKLFKVQIKSLLTTRI
ncbi:flippase [Chamaesiphon sp.]|uniref:flippase n=1 Tax=Chamaesiphon sp. TaxID=2814140 RepID=UPI003593C115